MEKSIITTDKAPVAIGPYSQGIAFGNLVFTSGQLPIDMATGAFPKTVQEQTKCSIENVRAILEQVGCTLADVVKTTVFIKNMDDFNAVNEVYAAYFTDDYPTRSCVEVARLPKDALVEVEVIAVKK